MDGDIQGVRILFKPGLDTVAVVGIKVKHTDPLSATFLPVAGSNHAVVEKAEPKGHVRFSMVTGRSGEAENIFRSARFQQINAADADSCG